MTTTLDLMIGRGIGRGVAALLYGLLAAPPVAAQQPAKLPGAVSGTPNPALQVQLLPAAPVLVEPRHGGEVIAPTGVPTVTFAWRPPATGAAPEYYLLSFYDAANMQAPVVAPVRIEARTPELRVARILPSVLTGRRIRWTVRSCRNVAVSRDPQAGCGGTASADLQWVAGPQAPDLVSPLPGAVLPPGSSVFTWRQTPAADYYLFCLAAAGVACTPHEVTSRDLIVVRRNGGENTSHAHTLGVDRLGHGLTWTVAACDQDTGRCEYQTNRRLLQVALPPPALAAPAASATVRSRQLFKWNAAPWADFHVLCLLEPGERCPASVQEEGDSLLERLSKTIEAPSPQSSARVLVFPESHETSFASGVATQGPPSTQLNASFAGFTGSKQWTVGGCKYTSGSRGAGTTACFYAPPRALQVRALWDLRARLDRVFARDDCDNISPGDWRVRVFMSAGGRFHASEWPAGSLPQDVDTGTTVPIGVGASLEGVDPALPAPVFFGTNVIDCDGDGLWTPLNITKGILGVVDTITNWTQTCGGEEVYEKSGDNDEVGTAMALLDRAQVTAPAFTLRRSVDSGDSPDCPSQSYRADFTVEGTLW